MLSRSFYSTARRDTGYVCVNCLQGSLGLPTIRGERHASSEGSPGKAKAGPSTHGAKKSKPQPRPKQPEKGDEHADVNVLEPAAKQSNRAPNPFAAYKRSWKSSSVPPALPALLKTLKEVHTATEPAAEATRADAEVEPINALRASGQGTSGLRALSTPSRARPRKKRRKAIASSAKKTEVSAPSESENSTQDTAIKEAASKTKSVTVPGKRAKAAVKAKARLPAARARRIRSRPIRGDGDAPKSPERSSKDAQERDGREQRMLAKALKKHLGGDIQSVSATTLEIQPVHVDAQPPVPHLSYGLERVLFNPGVYHLQDPRSRVYNFDPYLQKIMPIAEFDFNALKRFVTSSEDRSLTAIARAHAKRYTGSSSSMTGALSHFHYLLSQWRPVNPSMLSQGFPDKLRTFTLLQRLPAAIFLRWKDGSYAIDGDKQYDSANVLSMLGKSMEKLLTLPQEEYERYRKSSADPAPGAEEQEPETYHYCKLGDILMRSQLDAFDPRLPGTGMFDLKTRAVVSVRMDVKNFRLGTGYEIKNRHGEWESFEREYFDMIRAAFLKYSLQVRIGRMDGIFVAFHNTERIFGFQYISLPEMDATIHAAPGDTLVGDQEFRLSLALLNKVLDRATAKFPEQSLRIHFETREAEPPFMYIFAEPMSEEEITEIQTKNRSRIEQFEREILGLKIDSDDEDEASHEWERIQARVEEEMANDELSADRPLAGLPTSDPDKLELTGSERHGEDDLDDAHDGTSEGAELPEHETGDQSLFEGGHTHERDTRHGRTVEHGAIHAHETGEETGLESAGPHEPGTGQEHRVSREADDSRDEAGDEGREGPPWAHTTGDPAETDGTKEDGEDSDAAGDGTWLDKVAQEHIDLRSQAVGRSVLAMTLTVRNKVNGTYVVRPENLGPGDQWEVEYALAPIESDTRAWSLYRACQVRRKNGLEQDEDEGDEEAVSHYVRRLRELSAAGREWRKHRDELDAHRAPVVLGDRPSPRGH